MTKKQTVDAKTGTSKVVDFTAEEETLLEQDKIKQAELQAAYDALEYSRNRAKEYPALKEFAEAYCEKEIGEDSTKWDAYVIKYNLVRSNNPKPKE